MDAGCISALAAPTGPAIGALASLATTWLTRHSQTRAAQRVQDRARREALYGDFIREAPRLFADAFEHELDDPAKLVQLYAIVSMTRLFGQPRTLEEAERVMHQIGAACFAPNKELRLFADIATAGELDPLCAFSLACREELKLARPGLVELPTQEQAQRGRFGVELPTQEQAQRGRFGVELLGQELHVVAVPGQPRFEIVEVPRQDGFDDLSRYRLFADPEA